MSCKQIKEWNIGPKKLCVSFLKLFLKNQADFIAGRRIRQTKII